MLDILIVLLYLSSLVVISLILKKKASKNIDAYLLGSNKLPWYMLGLSNATGMFDFSTMIWLVTLVFVYGLKSIWILWLLPAFNQIFLMVYLSAWIRRSNVKTGAEWIDTRFGKSRQSNMARLIVVVFALFCCLGFMAYGYIGIGKFIDIFLSWQYISTYLPFSLPKEFVPHLYGILIMMFAVFYAILGGMTGIVWADILQYLIITISAIVIGLLAMDAMASYPLNVPNEWHSPLFGWKLNMDWTGIIDEVNYKINNDGYSLFSIFFMMMLFKGVLVSFAGPMPNNEMQKILSAKSPKEAAKMSGFASVALMPVRYLMIAGFAILGIIYYNQLNLTVSGKIDYAQIIPSTVNKFVPISLLGIMLAGLIAGFISTFAATLNTVQAYIVNDIYLKYINPDASDKKIGSMNYYTGILAVIACILAGILSKNANSSMVWIVSGLSTSYVVSNILKWHWWRFNGNGYFWGMIAGLLSTLIFSVILPDSMALYYFPFLLIISVIGCFAGTYFGSPTNNETLITFYCSVHPWGFWNPVYEMAKAMNPGFEKNKSFGTDMLNVVLGIIAQTSLVLIPIYLVLMDSQPLFISIIIFLFCAIILKKTWWDKLENEENEYPKRFGANKSIYHNYIVQKKI